MNLPQPWANYALMQAALRDAPVDDRAWGYEETLNRIAFSNSGCPICDPIALERSVQSAARRERYRSALLRKYAIDDVFDGRIIEILHAQKSLAAIRAKLEPEEWLLLCGVAEGRSYDWLGHVHCASAGALRVRVSRLRVRLQALAA